MESIKYKYTKSMAGFTVEKPEVGPHTFCKGVYNLLSRIRGKQGVQP